MVPELKDEIERKLVEALEFLFSKYDKGEINIDQFSTGIDVAWMCCSGLVSMGLTELMTSANELIERDRQPKQDFSEDFT